MAVDKPKDKADFGYFDSLVRQEMYFEMQAVEQESEARFEALLLWVIAALQTGKQIRQIKAYIKAQNIEPNLQSGLQKYMQNQAEIIGSNVDVSKLGKESAFGYTFLEQITERSRAIRRKAIQFMSRVRENIRAGESSQELLVREMDGYTKGKEGFWRSNAKASRNYAYEAADRESERAGNRIKGWNSVAVLDNRTSPICVSLHNQFYSREDYKTRGNIPNLPPRHQNCRSVIVTIFNDESIDKYKGENIETFLRRNPADAQAIMGKRKYELWSQGKAKIDKYIDLKEGGRRFYRNDEIVQRLGIKSKKRLKK